MGLIRIALTLVLIFLLLKLMVRMMFPFIIKLFFNRINRKFENEQQSQWQKTSDEDIHVDCTHAAEHNNRMDRSANIGEYVDFEEIDDEIEKI